jgi:hypothetical protein
MRCSDVTDLTDAVEALTNPVVYNHQIKDDNGAITRMHTAELPPLLDQLATAVGSSLSRDSGGGGKSKTGLLLNSAALFEAMKMGSAIKFWCHALGIRPSKDLRTSLLRWHGAYGEGESAAFYARQMQGWADQIRNVLDPLKPVPIKDPCTICGGVSYLDAEENEIPYPVVVEYRESDPMGTAQAICRRCSNVWEGTEAIGELMDELRDKTAG